MSVLKDITRLNIADLWKEVKVTAEEIWKDLRKDKPFKKFIQNT